MISLRAAIPLAFGLLFGAGSAQAAPIRPPLSPEPAPLVEKVHGTHRACRYSPAMDWWHRHVGRYNRPVSCGYRTYSPYYEPYWYAPYYGPGITLRFGHGHRFRGPRRHRR
jgi:hypothetical protein